jgi:large subunit ribosomal protein L25
MSEVKLIAHTGRELGTRPSRRLRAESRIPGVIYGLGRPSMTVSVDRRDVRLALSTDAGLNALLDLEVDGTTELAVVKEVQRHPVRREVIHIDFLRVDRDAAIEVDVPIHIEGEATQVTQENGIAEQRLMAVTVRVKPAEIPDSITVDISDMTLDRTITVAELDLPAGVEVVTPGDQAVVSAELTRAALVAESGEEGEEAADGAGTGSAEGDAEAGDSAGSRSED